MRYPPQAPIAEVKPEHRGALAARGLQGAALGHSARAAHRAELLAPEDDRDHPEGGAVADAGGDEQHQEHRQEARERLRVDEVA